MMRRCRQDNDLALAAIILLKDELKNDDKGILDMFAFESFQAGGVQF